MPVTISIGSAYSGMSGPTIDQLCGLAGKALFRAKLDGRNCVRTAWRGGRKCERRRSDGAG